MDLTVDVDRHDDHTVIKCSGELDTYNCGILRSAVVDLVEKEVVRVVIDLCDVEYVDSTGLGSLVGAMKRLIDHKGKMAIVANTPEIVKVFEITALKNVLCVKNNLPDAVDLVTGRATQTV